MVDTGKNVGILGMNGAGKSTLIKQLCGIIAPTNGSIKVDGKYTPFDKKKDYLRKIALVSGNKTQMNYDLSAKDNFHFLGAIYDVDKKTVDHKSESLAEQLGCFHLVDRQIRIEVDLEHVKSLRLYLSARANISNIKVIDRNILFEVAKDKLIEELKILLDQFPEKILSLNLDDIGKSEILKREF